MVNKKPKGPHMVNKKPKGPRKRQVGDLTGPNARLWWSPIDLSAKTDGEISAEKINDDIDTEVIPKEGVVYPATKKDGRPGRKRLILRPTVLKYLDLEKIKST